MDELPPELDAEALAKKFAAQFEAARNLHAEAWRNRPSGNAAEGN